MIPTSYPILAKEELADAFCLTSKKGDDATNRSGHNSLREFAQLPFAPIEFEIEVGKRRGTVSKIRSALVCDCKMVSRRKRYISSI
jgi:hypothetical protein